MNHIQNKIFIEHPLHTSFTYRKRSFSSYLSVVSLYSLSISYTSVCSSTAASIFIYCLPSSSSSSSSSSSVSTTPRPKSLCVNLAKIKESSTCAAEADADAVCCCWRRYNNNNKKYEDDKAQKTIRHNNEPSKIANASHSARYIRYMYSGIYHTHMHAHAQILQGSICVRQSADLIQ